MSIFRGYTFVSTRDVSDITKRSHSPCLDHSAGVGQYNITKGIVALDEVSASF